MDEICKEIRRMTVECIGSIGSGHIGGSMSIAELMKVLYFDKMNVDPSNPKMEGRDRLVVSKGHAGPVVYATLALKGFFPKEWLYTLNKFGTNLPSHCDMNKTPGVDMTAGSLGQGFSCAVGIAIGSKIKKDGATIYTVIGDGESQEGQIWEAAMLAASKKVDNLIGFTDYNGMQLDGNVEDINSLGNLKSKWKAFGWNVIVADGHNMEAILAAFKQAKEMGKKDNKPVMILMKTDMGKGVDFMQGTCEWHGKAPKPELAEKGLAQLQETLGDF